MPQTQSELFTRGMSDAFDDMAGGEPIPLRSVQSCIGAYWRGYERAIASRLGFQHRIETEPQETTLGDRITRRPIFTDKDGSRASVGPLLIGIVALLGLVVLAVFWR